MNMKQKGDKCKTNNISNTKHNVHMNIEQYWMVNMRHIWLRIWNMPSNGYEMDKNDEVERYMDE